jgi:hypothetical protein
MNYELRNEDHILYWYVHMRTKDDGKKPFSHSIVSGGAVCMHGHTAFCRNLL